MARATIVYDETCGFCLRSLEWLKARDGGSAFDAVGCQSEARRERFPDIAEEDCLARMHLVEPDGRRLSGGDAAAAILRRIPGWGAVGFLLALPVIRLATRAGYRLVARNRHRLGCRAGHCGL